MARCPTRFPPPFCPALQIPTTPRGAGRDGGGRVGRTGERKWAELRLTGNCQPIDWVRVFLFPAPTGLRVTTASVASDRGSLTPADCGGREASQSLPGAVWRDPTVSLVGGGARAARRGLGSRPNLAEMDGVGGGSTLRAAAAARPCSQVSVARSSGERLRVARLPSRQSAASSTWQWAALRTRLWARS